MKKLLFIALLVDISLLARGQESTCELKGTITSAGGEAITGATITLQSDTTALTLFGAVSNETVAKVNSLNRIVRLRAILL